MRNQGNHDWESTAKRGSGGGWSRVWRRLVDNPENPLGWSFYMFRAAGIDVRIHLFTVVYLALLLVSTFSPNVGGIHYILPLLVALFVVVLLHEFGHCFACRWVRGEANRIVLLPFGGLALCNPPHAWKPNLITTVGGPAVNVLLFPLTAGLMLAVGMGQYTIFNPLRPYAPFLDGSLSWSGTLGVLAKASVWWLHYTNIVILAFNMLLIMYPFDAGRIVHALMWKRMGYRKASEIAANIGLVGAIVLAALGLVLNKNMFIFIAIFGGVTCWMERKRARGESELAMGSLATGPSEGTYNPFAVDDDELFDAGPSKRELKRMEAQQQQQEEVDRILDKIARQGMASLTAKEKKTLDRASKASRNAD